jgi:hypothetical protein
MIRASRGKASQTCDWGVGKISALALAPDGMTAAVAGNKTAIVVWDLE